jgi:hypothetical protein
MTILYPIAPDGPGALAAPLGRAARARDAAVLVGDEVVFVTETIGPAFATRDAAMAAYAGRLDSEKVRVEPQDRYCELVELADGPPPRPVEPALKDGRRWPAPVKQARTVWRLRVSYWRPGAPPVLDPGPDQARDLRRKAQGPVAPDRLNALSRQPLRPVRPQQPLDIGLFERRLPESPDVIVPDE